MDKETPCYEKKTVNNITRKERQYNMRMEGKDVEDMTRKYSYYIGGSLVDAPRYGSKQFASPMKELHEQTVMVENCEENKNDSYRQRTKYDGTVDKYYSSYDLGVLIQNEESYLEGKLNSGNDVDYYSFFYGQRGFYSKMGISSSLTIRLENIPQGCDYDFIMTF